MKEQAICVKLKKEWMGNPAGTVLSLNKKMADSLFQRDTGEIVKPESAEKIKTKLQRREKDKMIKSTINK
jgi:hypothetical protein